MGKRFVVIAVVAAALASATVGIALAQAGGTAPETGEVIHVVYGPNAHVQYLDFEHDGMGFGDRLASVGLLYDQSQTHVVGKTYLDCVIQSPILDGGIFDCTYVLKLRHGDLVTHGIDPAGPSDVLFAITGGTGVYKGASGQAEYIDTDVTDIIVDLHG